MSQALRLVMRNTDLKMDREKEITSESEKEWPERWEGKPSSMGGIAKAKEKEDFKVQNSTHKIKIRTENNSLDNTPRRSLLTLQRAVGKNMVVTEALSQWIEQ